MDHDELFVALSYVTAFGSSSAASSSSAAPAKAAPAKAAPAKKPVDADELDLFGDEEEEDNGAIVNELGETAAEAKAAEARRERMAAAAALKKAADEKKNAGKVQEKKEKPVEKSLIVLDVKPWEADTDLVMVWNEIIKTSQEGLSWGQTYKLEPLAFGVKKLVMTCTIVDAKVLMEDVTDKIEALSDWVQSVEVASMNKIS